MDDAGRPVVLIAWIECKFCGRIDKAAHDFNYPADMASDMELFVWLPCERCGRLAKLHHGSRGRTPESVGPRELGSQKRTPTNDSEGKTVPRACFGAKHDS
jgi:hypothetical protein